MNKTKLVSTVTGAFSRFGFQVKKHSPEILVVAGIIGVVGSAVMACNATLKAQEVLAEANKDIEAVRTCATNPDLAEKYTEEDKKKDLAYLYIRTGVKVAGLYAPAIALGALSITGIVASNNILHKRNVALAAGYAAVDKGFKEYRNSVVERFGENVDRELKYGIKPQKVEETVVDEKTGKEKKVKKTIETVDPNLPCSPYGRFFDEGSRYWEKSAEENLFFLRAEQNLANDRLKSRGYLFLNEVLERLDIPTTRDGQHVGWVYDPKNPTYVDFGIYDTHRSNGKCRDFVNGYENVILLDFNVSLIDEVFEKYRR